MTQSTHARAFAPPPPPAGARENLVGRARAELGERMAVMGEPAFRARQLWH